jgi:hypothetical protein
VLGNVAGCALATGLTFVIPTTKGLDLGVRRSSAGPSRSA